MACRSVAIALIVLVCAAALAAQRRNPSFEVAAVKPSPPSAGAERNLSTENLRRPGGLHFGNAPLQRIVAYAFGLTPVQPRFGVLTDGSFDALLNARFTVNARAPAGTSIEEYPAMMRTRLAERFALRAHIESRQVSGYALTVKRPGRLGPALRPSTVDCDLVRKLEDREQRRSAPEICFVTFEGLPGGVVRRGAGNIGELANQLQGTPELTGPIVDATGLSGLFEWELTHRFTPLARADLPTFDDALEEQLGLTLEQRAVPLEVLVIESVEQPTPD